MPYFYTLRGYPDCMDSMKKIQQMSNMIIWSKDVHGIISMTDKPINRRHTEILFRKKNPVQKFTSLPIKPGTIIKPQPHESYGSMSEKASASTSNLPTNVSDYPMTF